VITPARLEEIRAVVAEKRAIHSELRVPLTLPSLRRVARREGVEIVARRHPRLGELVPVLGRWLIIIDADQPKLAWKVIGAHELAHLWLHHDPFFARTETSVYDKSPPWYDALREEEADVFAELLVRGPVTEPLTSNQKPANKRRRRAKQLELADPDGEAFLAAVKSAPRDPLPQPDPSPFVQLVIPREVWRSVRLDAVRRRAGHSTYRDDTIAMPHHELVTCTENVALAIVEDLARAGHKRTAVAIRRTIREIRRAREGREYESR
jgi:hypothetical protein